MILFGVWIFYLLLLNHRVIGDKNGVNVTVMGANVDDNGFVDFNESTLGNWEILCHTDNQSCCNKRTKLGDWFYPNGNKVLSFSDIGGEDAKASYVRNRGAGLVRLYRRYHETTLPSERGRFSCVIPNAQGNNQTYYVNILDIDRVTISPHNPRAVVGQSYNATCSVRITTNPLPENTPTPTFKWFYGPNKSMLITNGNNVTVSAVHNINNTYVSTIDLTPFLVSHAGIYTCQFGGNEGLNASIIITANDPSISSITITSDPASPITERTAVTLTCTVQLNADSELIQSPANLSVLMERDQKPLADETTLSLPRPTMSSTTYNYTLQVNSFGRNNAGTYACRASLNLPYSTISNTLTVTTIYAGVYIQLRDTVYSNNSDVLINDIGEGTNSLICFTDLVDCCTPSHSLNNQVLGNWSYPNGSIVERESASSTFYRNRGSSRVRLNRRETTTLPLGLFCCEVPSNATNNDIRVCANIVSEFPSVTTTVPTTPSVSEHTSNTIMDTSTLEYTTSFPTIPSASEFPSMTTAATTVTILFDDSVSTHNMSNTTTITSSSENGGEEEQQNRREDTNAAMDASIAVVITITVILFTVIFAITVVVIYLFRWKKSTKNLQLNRHISQGPMYVSYSEMQDNVEKEQYQETPQINTFPCDMCVTEGKGVYFKIEVCGVPQPTVTWYHNGEKVKADYAREIKEDGSLAIPSTELKHSGVYKAVVTNQHGSEEREVKLTVDKEEGESSENAAIDEIVSTCPIPILEFGKNVSQLHANSNQPFKDLYQSLDSGGNNHKTSYGTHPDRKILNRFGNIVVYDDNRITLEPIPEADDCYGDYINACYIHGYSTPDKFIATQGPLPSTVVDFWRLIWQERPSTIVMVTNIKEESRIKCEQYWPDSGKEQIGPFQVTITDQQVFVDYTIRTLSVSLDTSKHSHTLTQYHFTAWPDHGVPDNATSVLAFHRRIKAQHNTSKGPMVVHCSAGIGRTGTFIVIDHILEQIEKERIIDIPGAITKIRQQRMKMVQTHEQFTFIHDAMLESITCGDTQISATNFWMATAKMKKNGQFENQMKILEQVSPNPKEVQCSSALAYPLLNRANGFLPDDRWRVVLKGEQPDYIHAVSVNGYKQKKVFIIAQGPMETTVRNFWKMIYDRKCAVVVMLSDLVERREESSAQYWPSSGSYEYGEYCVELLGEEPLGGFIIRDLCVTDIRIQKPCKVIQLQITNWKPDGSCSNLKTIIDVIEEMTKVQIRSGNKPIVVHCNDTVTRSGMFCAIATTIERCKTEGVVDVFQVVKALRVHKPGAVPTVDQYKLIFEAILVFLESYETYANFQNI